MPLIKCKTCSKEENLEYKAFWYRKNKGNGDCQSCAAKKRINTHWKTGQKSWNKGLPEEKQPRYGNIVSEETKGKLRIKNLGRKMTDADKQKMSIAKIGKIGNTLGKHWKVENTSNFGMKGELHWNWIEDRNKLKTKEGSEERRSTRYKEWRKKVVERDAWKCKINNKDCKGRLEIHHILGFTEHKELKYEVNNGITLCHFHHPRKINDEMRMIPVFQDIVLSIVK